MITRKQYIECKFSHREYYAQFVTEKDKLFVLEVWGMERLLRANKEGSHLNSLPLEEWDNMAGGQCAPDNSLSSKVCVLKEAAKQLIEEHINGAVT